MMLSRRKALFGLLAAPVIIRTSGLLMPIKPEKLVQLDTDCFYPGDDVVDAVSLDYYSNTVWQFAGGKWYSFENTSAHQLLDVLGFDPDMRPLKGKMKNEHANKSSVRTPPAYLAHKR